MSSNSVCNHTRDQTNQTPATRSSDFVNHSYDYRPNWTPLSPVTITNSSITIILIATTIFPPPCGTVIQLNFQKKTVYGNLLMPITEAVNKT